MLFNSLSFFIFFPVVTILYYLLPFRYRWLLLLIASCIFYLSFIPEYLFILAYLIIIDYSVGRLLKRANGRRRTYLLIVSLVANISILVYYKYAHFILSQIQWLEHLFLWNYSPIALNLILPVGLSFHVFQSLSYVIEVYRRKYKPESHLGKYALFVMFYPQMVAGPIERPQHLLPQLSIQLRFDHEQVAAGLQRMLLGFFKKMIIADRLALLVNQIYDTPHSYIGFPLVVGTVAFAFQIYCDFSGYSDIAIGAAKVMGITLRENFTLPYLASSITDFWRRWHMSLYSWFRDYLYIPLGGNRKGMLIQIRNILIVFFCTGLWHGASWTFVVWGLLHGIAMVCTLMFSKIPNTSEKRTPVVVSHAIQILLTFAFVTATWIFFRAQSLPDATYIATHLFSGSKFLFQMILTHNWQAVLKYLFFQGNGMGISLTDTYIVLFCLSCLVVLEFLQGKNATILKRKSAQWIITIAMTLAVINLGVITRIPFIYFQF